MEKHTDSTHSPNKHVERSARTRSDLLGAARALFASRGFAAVSTEEIVRATGVTRGALYHQFRGGKEELFREVFERIEEELTERIAQTVLGGGSEDPLEALAAGAEAYLAACLEPEVLQVTLRDAPAVLGWEAWREIGERHGLGIVRAGLAAAMDAGAIEEGPVDPLAHVLLGALEEAALYVARAEDRVSAQAEMGTTVRRLLNGLR